MHELPLGVLFWIVPEKFVLVQPAVPVDKGNTKHFFVARHDHVCARAGFFRLENTLDGFLNDNVRKYGLYFYVLFDGVGVRISGRSRSRNWNRSLRRWSGSLLDRYGCDGDNGYMFWNKS